MRDGKSNDLEHVAFIIGKCVEREGCWNKGGRNIYNFREWDELKKKGGGEEGMIGLYLDIVIPPFYYIYPSKECSE